MKKKEKKKKERAPVVSVKISFQYACIHTAYNIFFFLYISLFI